MDLDDKVEKIFALQENIIETLEIMLQTGICKRYEELKKMEVYKKVINLREELDAIHTQEYKEDIGEY